MNKPIGGRGKKAPYKTTHVRIPIDLKAQVEKLVEDYRNNGLVNLDKNDDLFSKEQSINYRKLVDSMIEEFKQNGLYLSKHEEGNDLKNPLINEDEAYESAKKIIQDMRTKKAVAAALLSCIYGSSTQDLRLD
jgi:hypothetical protein